MTKWTSNTPLLEVTRRLHVLALRLARVRLEQQAQRNVAMLKALSPEEK